MSAFPTLYCSFCEKSQHDVPQLIAGNKGFICDACVDLAAEIVADKRVEIARAPLTPEQEARVRELISECRQETCDDSSMIAWMKERWNQLLQTSAQSHEANSGGAHGLRG